jgi:hypothetical protein
VLEAALQRAMEKLPEGAVRSKWQARASSDLAQVMMTLDCASSDLAQVMMTLDCASSDLAQVMMALDCDG